jgi:hypothetical protein
MRHLSKKLWPAVILMAALILLTNIAYAHERRMVGDYEFVVGFLVEPAIEGEKNGVDLRVRIPSEEEGGTPTPVEGVHETLQVEITHVPSGVSKSAELRAIFNDPGHYTSDLIPTAPGPYRFHFTGSVGDLTVDEIFESGPGTFGEVEPSVDFQFPETIPQAREMESAIRGTQDTAQQSAAAITAAEEAAAAAQSTATIALILGAVGLLAGAGGVVMALRKK